MPRMIAVKTYAGYRAARIEYDREDLIPTLERHWSTTMAMHGLIVQGDMLTLTEKGGMRVSNRGLVRCADTLAELVEGCAREGIHCLSVYDERQDTINEFGEWNMTCEPGSDLFIENIASARPWHHIIDGMKVEEMFRKAA